MLDRTQYFVLFLERCRDGLVRRLILDSPPL